MSTVRERIVLAVIDALGTDAPEGFPAPVRARLDSPDADQLPALTVYQATEIVAPMRDSKTGAAMRGPVVRRALLLNVEISVAAEGDGVDALLDPYLAWITSAVVGCDTIGGLADNPPDEAGTQFGYEQAKVSIAKATVTFRIEYPTLPDNAELQVPAE